MTSLRVIVFEEQWLLRDALQRALPAAGVDVLACHHLPQALLAAVALHKPQVVLMDPPRAMEEAHYLITETCQLGHPARVLVASTGRSGEDIEGFFRVGASGYLDKQTTPVEALVEGLHAIDQGRNVYPPSAVASLLRAAPSAISSGPVRGLSLREKQVLGLVSVGADNLQIAARLSISERTVKAHVSSLYRKLGMENRTQLALLAREAGVRPELPDAHSTQAR